nr:MAG TPA: hypothetical protein [Caudoviricetes sp.]
MLNTKLGFFYVHRFTPDINVASKSIYEIVEIYLRKRIRLSFLDILFAQG